MVRQRWDALWKSSCLNPGKNQVGAVWSLGDASSFVTSVVFPGYPQVLQLGFSFCFGCNERSLWRICVCCLSLGLKGFCGFLGKHQILLHRMLTAHSCFALCEMVKINNVTAVLKVSGEADTHWTCIYSFPMDVYHLPVAVLWLWCESAGSLLEVNMWRQIVGSCSCTLLASHLRHYFLMLLYCYGIAAFNSVEMYNDALAYGWDLSC